jgi:hypothetical protein
VNHEPDGQGALFAAQAGGGWAVAGTATTTRTRADAPAQRERVRRTIADTVLSFCTEAKRTGGTFHLADLALYVAHRHRASAPGSADRILRLLRDRGHVRYRCVDRAASAYVVEWVLP